MTIRVVLVEPDGTRRDDLRRTLGEFPDIEVVATADDVTSTVLQATRLDVHVVLVTQRLGPLLPELCSQLQKLASVPRTLLLDDEGDEDSLIHAIDAGVDGYAITATDGTEVCQAIRALSRGELVIPPNMLGQLIRRLIGLRREAAHAADLLVQLTPREREVLLLLVDRQDHDAIGKTLFISPETARTHIQRVLRKLDVHSRAEAIALVERTGLADRLQRMVERSMS